MNLFRLWASGLDVAGVVAQLDAQPELWNANQYRTESPDSAHHGVDDIWVRWREPSELTTVEAFDEPHAAVFWPAWHALPALHRYVFDAVRAVLATQIGGILITRTPAGGRVKPHIDHGWHARFYNTKLYLVLASNPFCINRCGDEAFNTRRGDLVEYPNNVVHSVTNDGDTPHINAILCFRTEG